MDRQTEVFLGGVSGKEPACQSRRHRRPGFIPGSERSPGGGHGNPLQYSCLENPHGKRSLLGYSLRGCKELDTTDMTEHTHRQIEGVGSKILFRFGMAWLVQSEINGMVINCTLESPS